MEESLRQLVHKGEITGWRFTFKKSLEKDMLGIMSFSHLYRSGGTGTRHLWSFLLIFCVCDGPSEENTDMLSHTS